MAPDSLEDAPLLSAWMEATRRLGSGELRPFTIPGHKHRIDLIGEIVAGDVPLYGGLAPVRDADALVRRAEARTAERFSADWCRYSVGGSTHGNQAVLMAVGRPGDTVVVDRTSHRSVSLGLVLAGLRPVCGFTHLWTPRRDFPGGSRRRRFGRRCATTPTPARCSSPARRTSGRAPTSARSAR